MKSNKPVLPTKRVFGKRMFVFPKEYGTENVGGKRGMIVSIGRENTFIPVDEPVDLSYDVWMLLKNIGRIGRVIAVQQTDNEKV